ncbi:MAG: hypothetical protein GXP00_01015 [Alphaproteobacteria bacterium]|nr:hypothetical protein [Alphaproteobacteria bacterium]
MMTFKKRTLGLAAIGLLATTCTSATAEDYTDKTTEGKKQEKIVEQALETTQEALEQVHEKLLELALDGETIQIEITKSVEHALKEAELDLKEVEIDIDEKEIIRDVQNSVRIALKDAEADLKKMERELKQFDGEKLRDDMDNMRRGLEEAVKNKLLTQTEMERMITLLEDSHVEALRHAHESLKEIRKSLKEIREEAKRNENL